MVTAVPPRRFDSQRANSLCRTRSTCCNRIGLLAGLALLCALVPTLLGVSAPTSAEQTRFIVTFDASVQPRNTWLLNEQINPKLSTLPHAQWQRLVSGNARILTVIGDKPQTEKTLRTLQQHPAVESVVKDVWVTPTEAINIHELSQPITASLLATSGAAPNDPLFTAQWQLHDDNWHAAAIDAVGAWQITHGSADTVIAVIDTGVRPEHPDLVGRLLPGYDFVSGLHETGDVFNNLPIDLQFARSNDGDGRDPDPTDPGDGVNAALAARLTELNIPCDAANSTWHGTGVASLIAANANDGVGLAGIDWNTMILPVRAIGRCGGHRSDLIDAIRWAAGVADPALPTNPYPAHIINLSLGMNDRCSAFDQAAIDDAVKAGAIVVSAVGNQGRNTAEHPSSPAQCLNVVGVAATDESGYLANYSNFGRDADIAAPGGMRYPSQYGVEVATNAGVITDSAVQTWKTVSGTSVAAPLVSGTLGLMRSVQPNISADELTRLLYASAAPFPNDSRNRSANYCNRDTCGTGMLNTHHAVRTAVAYIPSLYEDASDIWTDEPALGAANGPVVVGGSGLGCSIVSVQSLQATGTGSYAKDPSLFLLLIAALVGLIRRTATNL